MLPTAVNAPATCDALQLCCDHDCCRGYQHTSTDAGKVAREQTHSIRSSVVTWIHPYTVWHSIQVIPLPGKVA